MKILSIHDYPPHVLGGAESQAARLVSEWLKLGCTVKSACHRTPGGWLDFGDKKVPIHHIEAESAYRAIRALKYGSRLAFWLLKEARNADIIYFRFLTEGALTAITLKSLGLIDLPLVACPGCFGQSGDAAIIRSLPGWKRLIPLINKYCDRINILSEPIAQELSDLGILERKFVRIPNGIEIPPRYYKSVGSPLKFIYAGRCEPSKGLNYLLEAWQLFMVRAQKPAVLTIVGDGSQKGMLMLESKTLGISSSVTFTGRVDADQMQQILGDHDILILPSLEEGFSNAALEAMASAKPLIVTITGGIDRYILPEFGWTIPPANASALMEALLEASQLESKVILRMGQQARNLVQDQLDIQVLARMHLELFRELVSTTPLVL